MCSWGTKQIKGDPADEGQGSRDFTLHRREGEVYIQMCRKADSQTSIFYSEDLTGAWEMLSMVTMGGLPFQNRKLMDGSSSVFAVIKTVSTIPKKNEKESGICPVEVSTITVERKGDDKEAGVSLWGGG